MKKLSAYNKFMRTEMARLKESEPDITHKERFVDKVLVIIAEPC